MLNDVLDGIKTFLKILRKVSKNKNNLYKVSEKMEITIQFIHNFEFS